MHRWHVGSIWTHQIYFESNNTLSTSYKAKMLLLYQIKQNRTSHSSTSSWHLLQERTRKANPCWPWRTWLHTHLNDALMRELPILNLPFLYPINYLEVPSEGQHLFSQLWSVLNIIRQILALQLWLRYLEVAFMIYNPFWLKKRYRRNGNRVWGIDGDWRSAASIWSCSLWSLVLTRRNIAPSWRRNHNRKSLRKLWIEQVSIEKICNYYNEFMNACSVPNMNDVLCSLEFQVLFTTESAHIFDSKVEGCIVVRTIMICSSSELLVGCMICQWSRC